MLTSCAGASRPGLVTLAITSGKGGVGKTNLVVNLAVSLARLRSRVAILDADFGLGNVDVLLGLTPPSHLGHLLNGDKDIHEVMVEGPHGVRIIPASSGLPELTALTAHQWRRLETSLQELRGQFDYLLIDTGAGISNNVIGMLTGAERVLVVTSLEPTAIVDAYAVIKVVTMGSPRTEIGVVVNEARNATEADLVFRQLDVAATRFLHRRLHYDGFVAADPAVREAVLMQRPVVEHAPGCRASRCFKALAAHVSGLTPLGGPGLRLVPKTDARAARLADMEAPQCA